MSRSSSTSPSEGEIIESSSEKANKSIKSFNETAVDRRSRNRISVSRSRSPYKSPSPYRSPGQSRDGSRSPYRESRGPKRQYDDDHYDRTRNDPRRFKVSYESSQQKDRENDHQPYRDPHHRANLDKDLTFDDGRKNGIQVPGRNRRRYGDHATSMLSKDKSNRYDLGIHRKGHINGHPRRDRDERVYCEGRDKFSNKQSVSDRRPDPIATASMKQIAEIGNGQIQQNGSQNVHESNSETTKPFADGRDDTARITKEVHLDEAAIIEERRKRREAIKAKYNRDRRASAQDQALESESKDPPITLQTATFDESLGQREHGPIANRVKRPSLLSASPMQSPPATPGEELGRESLSNLIVDKDAYLANSDAVSRAAAHEDEHSAADYDPTIDMQEDQLRHDQQQRNEQLSATVFDETKQVDQDVLIPVDAANILPEKMADTGLDMFAEEDKLDMFAEASAAPNLTKKESAKAVAIPQPTAIDMSMLDDWDDSENYYKVILGELFDGRYHVQSNLGKGMFSGVVRATDQKNKRVVAIKLIRNNETMKKAGYKEIGILQQLNKADPEDKKHLIRLERYFDHKGHLCMVFENLSINLREVLKKFGRDVGINLKAVRMYAQQMFIGLGLLRKCNVVHADLKPDNVLVNESRTILKICDLGSASDASENEITQYLVSRFYRAPEIILGMPYDFAIDMWSIGCTLFELYTGKILFTGRSNNQMLRAIMECRGKFSHKVLRKAQFAGYHFDDLLNFRSVEKDKISGKDTVRILNHSKPTRDLKTRLMSNVKGMSDAELKEINLFVDLLERCLNLNPDKRCTPNEALKHPFIMRQKL